MISITKIRIINVLYLAKIDRNALAKTLAGELIFVHKLYIIGELSSGGEIGNRTALKMLRS